MNFKDFLEEHPFKIDCKNLRSLLGNNALASVMINNKDKAEEISRTLTPEDRTVTVEVLFNGVSVPAQILEDWLKDQHQLQSKKIFDNYSDIEKEIKSRVELELTKVKGEYIENLKQKTYKIQEVLSKISDDLEYSSFD